jgi:VCBS repeat-containing protein
MRSRLIALATLICGGLSLALVPAHAATNPGLTTWYLHATGGCTSGTPEQYFISTFKDAKDDDGCSSVPVYEYTYDANGPLTQGLPAGTTVAGTFYLESYDPYQYTLTVSLNSKKPGGHTTMAGQTTTSSVTSLGILGSWQAVPFKFTTKKAIDAGQILNFDVIVNSPTAITGFVGYAGTHHSSFKLS